MHAQYDLCGSILTLHSSLSFACASFLFLNVGCSNTITSGSLLRLVIFEQQYSYWSAPPSWNPDPTSI